MATSGLLSAWLAVSAGISPSMEWNAENLSLLMALCTSLQTTAEQTPTYTKQLRLEATVRESLREQFEWESMSETAWG